MNNLSNKTKAVYDLEEKARDLRLEIGQLTDELEDVLYVTKRARRILSQRLSDLYEELDILEEKFNPEKEAEADQSSESNKEGGTNHKGENFSSSSKKESIEKEAVLSDEDQAELKRLYRTLAHQFHPDKPAGSAEMMKLINSAYGRKDLGSLKRLAENASTLSTANEANDLEQSLREEINLLEKQIIEIKTKTAEEKSSEIYELALKIQKEGEQVIDGLEKALKERVLMYKEKLRI